jgi:CRP-like cAMP-binding protein
MQIGGAGHRINSKRLEEVQQATPELHHKLSHYVVVNGLQVGQIAACNRLHQVEQRLARWLLMCQDRVDSPILPLTHDFLAQMLGAGRPTVTLACASWRRPDSLLTGAALSPFSIASNSSRQLVNAMA